MVFWKPTFSRAQKSKDYRQPYLNRFLDMYPSEHVRYLRYNDGGRAAEHELRLLLEEGRITMSHAADLYDDLSKGVGFLFYGGLGTSTPSGVFVNTPEFFVSELEFEVSLRGYAYKVAEDFSKGIVLSDDIVLTHKNIRDISFELFCTLLAMRGYGAMLDLIRLDPRFQCLKDSETHLHARRKFMKERNTVHGVQSFSELEFSTAEIAKGLVDSYVLF